MRVIKIKNFLTALTFSVLGFFFSFSFQLLYIFTNLLILSIKLHSENLYLFQNSSTHLHINMDTNQGLPSVISLYFLHILYSLANSITTIGTHFIAFFFHDLAVILPSLNSICGLFIQHIFLQYLQYAGTGQSALHFKNL